MELSPMDYTAWYGQPKEDCKKCGGTGVVSGKRFDPPEQCDCHEDY